MNIETIKDAISFNRKSILSASTWEDRMKEIKKVILDNKPKSNALSFKADSEFDRLIQILDYSINNHCEAEIIKADDLQDVLSYIYETAKA